MKRSPDSEILGLEPNRMHVSTCYELATLLADTTSRTFTPDRKINHVDTGRVHIGSTGLRMSTVPEVPVKLGPYFFRHY